MQIDGQHPVGPDAGDHIGHQLGGDGHPHRAWPAVLACIAHVGDDGRDPIGRGAPERVHHHQQLHQVFIGRGRGRLDHEHVPAAHVLADLDHHLAIAEAIHGGLAERDLEMVGDRLRQRGVGVAREKHQIVY